MFTCNTKNAEEYVYITCKLAYISKNFHLLDQNGHPPRQCYQLACIYTCRHFYHSIGDHIVFDVYSTNTPSNIAGKYPNGPDLLIGDLITQLGGCK
jgi:hypothetical protein